MQFKTFLTIASAYLFSCVANGQECKGLVTLGDIYTSLNQVNVGYPSDIQLKISYDFDFTNFVPVKSKISEDDYFNVGYDKNRQIVMVEHVEKNIRLGNFKMYAYHFPNFRIMFFLVREIGGTYSYMPCVFVTLLGSKKSFMINMLPQFGEGAMANTEFDETSAPIGKLSELSAIMSLNSDFYPEYLIRVHDGRILMGSRLDYLQDTNVIDSEELFFFNMPPYNSQIPAITEKSCLDNLNSIFDACCAFRCTVEPKINQRYKHVPLWYWGGAHSYK